MEQMLVALFTVVVGVLGCIAYFVGSNLLLDVIYPTSGKNSNQNIQRSSAIRPWLFMGPAIVFLVIYLVYPVINSIYLSFHGPSGKEFIGFERCSVDESKVDKLLAKGWVKGLPEKVVKKRKVKVNDAINKGSDSISSTESSGAADGISPSE